MLVTTYYLNLLEYNKIVRNRSGDSSCSLSEKKLFLIPHILASYFGIAFFRIKFLCFSSFISDTMQHLKKIFRVGFLN